MNKPSKLALMMGCCLIISLTLILLPVLVAQEFRGRIAGTVIDPGGAVIAGARVKVVSAETGVAQETNTNDSGAFQAPFLLPGTYKVTVEAPGMKRAEWPAVTIATTTNVDLRIQMELGTVDQSVTVTAEPPLLNLSGADLAQNIDKRYIAGVAVQLNRNAISVAHLAPGVTGKLGTFSSNDQANISIGGGGSTDTRNEFTLDGIPNTVPQGGGNIVFVPSLDTVEDVKVHTTMFDASLGHSNGGAVNITTRGGTNEFHGTGYLYKRWAALDANSWINNRKGLDKPPVNYRQWGFTIGGPVVLPRIYQGKNRTFFFFSREEDKSASSTTRQSSVPSALEREGDFSQTLSKTGVPLSIYDPDTTVVTGSKAVRQLFAGNKIPSSRLNPTGVAVLKTFPLPNQGSTVQIGNYNWASTKVSDTSNYNTNVRVDHAVSDRHRVFGRFSRLFRDQGGVSFFPANDFPIGGTDSIADIARVFHSFVLDDTLIPSASMAISIRYGLSRRTQTRERGGYGLDATALSLPGSVLAAQSHAGYPLFKMTGENMATIGSNFQKEATDQHALFVTTTKQTGSHSTKFGIDYRMANWNRLIPGNSAPGSFAFSSVFTQQDPFTKSTGNYSGSAKASLLLGAPDSGSIGYTSPISLRNHYLGAFVQDEWRLTSTLTLSAGLRYELETPWVERYDRMSYGFNPAAAFPVTVPGLTLQGGLLFAGKDGNSRRGGRVDTNNFGPRLGVAWQARRKMVVRAGYGLFYGAQTFNSDFLGEVDTFGTVTNMVGTNDGGATVANTLRNPFPNGISKPVGSSLGLATKFGDPLSYYDLNRVSPYNQQWQVSLQHELPWRSVIDVAYFGMLSLKQFESFNLNEKPDRYLALGSAENTSVKNPFYGYAPLTSTLGASSNIAQSRLWPAFPQFNSLTVQGANTGRAIYHALQWKVDKRFSHGFSALFGHTFSKLIDNNTTSIVNPRHYRSVSGYDQTHTLRLAGVWQLPGKWRTGVMQAITGGWELSGLFSVETGTPLTVTDANGRPIRIKNPERSGSVSNRLGDIVQNGVVMNPYFDTTAFQALPNQYTVSPEPPYLSELRSPTATAINLSAHKSFKLYERLRLQIRMDAIGLTNTPNFGAPGTDMSTKATFGVINSASGSRQMMGSARLSF